MKEKYGTIPSLKTTSQMSCGSSVLLRITLSPQTALQAAAKACPAGTWGGSWGPTLAPQAPQSMQETLSLASWVQPMLCTLGSSCSSSGRGLPARPRACRQQKTILHSGAFQQVRGFRKTKVLYRLFSSKGIMRLSYISFLFLFLLPVLSKFPVEVHVKFIWRKKKTQVVILIPTKCRAAQWFFSQFAHLVCVDVVFLCPACQPSATSSELKTVLVSFGSHLAENKGFIKWAYLSLLMRGHTWFPFC